MTQKIETIEIKNAVLGRVVINRADYDPDKHELWREVEKAETPEGLTESAFRELPYADQKSFASLYGIAGNGENALVEKLKEKGAL